MAVNKATQTLLNMHRGLAETSPFVGTEARLLSPEPDTGEINGTSFEASAASALDDRETLRGRVIEKLQGIIGDERP